MTAIRQLQITTHKNRGRAIAINEDSLSTKPRSRIQYGQQSGERLVAPPASSSTFDVTSRIQDSIWYKGVFGSVAVQQKWISTNRSGSRTAGKPVPAKRILTITSPILRRALELYFGASFVSVPRALRVYQIIHRNTPIFTKIRYNDLEGIQNEFSNGTISPFIVDQDGRTLLHVMISVISCRVVLIADTFPGRCFPRSIRDLLPAVEIGGRP